MVLGSNSVVLCYDVASAECLLYVIFVFVLKVLPQYHVCRDSVGECDVPEFCDGISGQVSVPPPVYRLVLY